jgi:hypothetical protein
MTLGTFFSAVLFWLKLVDTMGFADEFFIEYSLNFHQIWYKNQPQKHEKSLKHKKGKIRLQSFENSNFD